MAETATGTPRTFDVHMHVAGNGCCNSGCWLAPEFSRRFTFRLLRLLYRVNDQQMTTTIDADWGTLLASTVRASCVDQGVILGFDGVYDPQTGVFDRERSQLVVPPEWIFHLCRQHRELLPGPSINPYRHDALQRLEYCIDQGAVLIKWLPPAQAIDPGDRRLDDFYRLAAAAKLPLLVHMGRERTFRTITNAFNDVGRLRRPLDAGVPVICAHTATRVLGTDEADQTADLVELLNTYPHLWVDNSGLCNPSRFAHLPALAKDARIEARTLYGSDFPVPSSSIYYLGQLGPRQVWRLEREANVITRDVGIKRAFGYRDTSLSRAGSVLAHLDRWPRP